MTPHVSGTSLSAQARYAAGTREILECFFDERPIREEYLIVDGGALAGAGAHSYSAGNATGGSEEAARFEARLNAPSRRHQPAPGLGPGVAARGGRAASADAGTPLPRQDLLAFLAGADAALTLLFDRVDEAFLDAAGPQLRCVANVAVGFDNVDLEAAARRGARREHTRGPRRCDRRPGASP